MRIEDYERQASRGFAELKRNGVLCETIPAIDRTGAFRAAFTTRIGGVSPAPYASLNLSVTREESSENKRENLRRACHAVGVSSGSLVRVNYEHGDGIAAATREAAAAGFWGPSSLPPCDALIVCEPGVTAVTLHADCVPVFFADPARRVGAVCHAGWKGTALGLPAKVIRRLTEKHACDRNSMLVAVGPHIRGCCFEVGPDVAERFENLFGPETVSYRAERTFVSLERAILKQLMAEAIPPENVTLSSSCTSCNPSKYYSHRRDKGQTGAMASFMALL